MSSLSKALETVRTEIGKHRGKNLSEENTKAALINPVLRALGWNVENLEQVSMEYRGKDRKHKPPDYILLLNGKPKLLVEAKRLGENLDGDRWADALMGYVGAAAAGARWIVLTNGDEYQIYNATATVSSFGQRLFRTVRITDRESQTNKTRETLCLLSKQGLLRIGKVWRGESAERDRGHADRQVRAAIKQISSQQVCKWLTQLVRKSVGLPRTSVQASLSRLHPHLTFSEGPGHDGGDWTDRYIDFWQPIRCEAGRLFAGKPARWPGISKTVRGISVALVVLDHACRVDLGFGTGDKSERREKALRLLPELKGCELSDTPKWCGVRFRVLDKGLKDREHWREIQDKLKSLGENIYKVLEESDV